MRATDGGTSADEGAAPSPELRQLAEAMSAVARDVEKADGRPVDQLVRATLDQVPGAQAVSLTLFEAGQFRTDSWTDEVARRADGLQYELGRGPCIDAVLEASSYASGDVAADPRWGDWGPRVAADVGVRSVLAYRLVLEGERRAIASLNVYSDQRDAFDDRALQHGVLLATHGSLLVTALLAREAASELAAALQGNREIGVAMGVLMYRHRLTRDQAFDLLRLASQDLSRPLSDVATEVADTGDLAMLRERRRGAMDADAD